MAIYDMKLINHKCDKCVLFSLNITEVNLVFFSQRRNEFTVISNSK